MKVPEKYPWHKAIYSLYLLSCVLSHHAAVFLVLLLYPVNILSFAEPHALQQYASLKIVNHSFFGRGGGR